MPSPEDQCRNLAISADGLLPYITVLKIPWPWILRYVLLILLTFVFFTLLNISGGSKTILSRGGWQQHAHMFLSSKLGLVAELRHYVTKTHITHTTHLLYCDMLCTMKLVLVSFLPDGQGCNCETHPYGCGNRSLRVRAMVWAGWCICILMRRQTLQYTRLEMPELMAVAFASQGGNTPLEKILTDLMVCYWRLPKSFFLILQTGARENCITTIVDMLILRPLVISDKTCNKAGQGDRQEIKKLH